MIPQTTSTAPRRLIDYSAVKELEKRAVLDPRLTLPSAIMRPPVALALKQLFGIDVGVMLDWLNYSDVDDDEIPDDIWDYRWGIERLSDLSDRDLLSHFDAQGWDVRDDQGLALRTIRILAPALQLAISGELGAHLPKGGQSVVAWEEDMVAQAARFRAQRRVAR